MPEWLKAKQDVVKVISKVCDHVSQCNLINSVMQETIVSDLGYNTTISGIH